MQLRFWLKRGIEEIPHDVLTRIEDRMRPGAMSSSGFLGPSEALLDVLKHDAEALRSIGVTATAIGARINAILSEARARAPGLGSPVLIVGNRFEVYGLDEVSFGRQDCPFLDHRGRPCPRWGSQDYEIGNGACGLRFKVTGLTAHLILDHGFFEGNVPYRIDPVVAARVLELMPDAAA